MTTQLSDDRFEKLLISKSNPFLLLTRTSDLTLQELKILDCFLARINPTDPTSTSVRIAKGDLEKMCGGTRIKRADLISRLRRLCTNVTLFDPDEPDSFKVISLFSEAAASWDNDSGTWIVDLECTDKAKKYIFNLPQFLRYQLQRVMNLRSRYTYTLFLYLRKNRFRSCWREDISKLREELSCTDATYQDFKYFNSKILKPAQKELAEKSDCLFSYRPIRNGGKRVIMIEFRYIWSETDKAEDAVFSMPDGTPEPDASVNSEGSGIPAILPPESEIEISSPKSMHSDEALPIPEYDEDEEPDEFFYADDLLSFMHDSAAEFTYQELSVLRALVLQVPESKLPMDRFEDDPYFPGSILACSAYFTQKVEEMNYYDSMAKRKGKSVKNRFLYLRKSILSDINT